MDDELLIARNGDTLRLTINRPERRNALTIKLILALAKAIAGAQADSTVRAIILTGAGELAFCTGADLKDPDTPFQYDHAEYHTPFANLLRIGRACDVPIIGRLNGLCLAGGMGLFGLCDIVIAADTARIGLPEVKVGLFPMQVLAVLRDLIPSRILAEMCITGEPLSASQALAVGIINRVVPQGQLDLAVEEMVASVTRVSSVAIRRGKYAARTMQTMAFEEMIAFAETQVMPMSLTQDAKEGREAFAARRQPVWPDR